MRETWSQTFEAMDSATLRPVIAIAAGILAQKTGSELAAHALERIAQRLPASGRKAVA